VTNPPLTSAERAAMAAALRRVADLLDAGELAASDVAAATAPLARAASATWTGVAQLRLARGAPLTVSGRARLAAALALALLGLLGHVQACRQRGASRDSALISHQGFVDHPPCRERASVGPRVAKARDMAVEGALGRDVATQVQDASRSEADAPPVVERGARDRALRRHGR
jgi:hypothetical protein